MLKYRLMFYSLIAHLLICNLFVAPAFAACGSVTCQLVLRPVQDKYLAIDRLKDVLARNEDYLKKNADGKLSALIKVRSNILTSNLQIEALQNENLILTREVQAKGCLECLPKVNSAQLK